MTLSQLLESLHTLQLGDPELLLATRHVDGKLLDDPKKVHLREIALIEIDEDDAELKLVPRSIVGAEGAGISVFSLGYLEAYREARTDLQDFQVFGVDRRGLLDDGSVVSLNLPLLGVCHGGQNAAWLILPPEDQWPPSWFNSAVASEA